jgi:hypothetical protein
MQSDDFDVPVQHYRQASREESSQYRHRKVGWVLAEKSEPLY